jgi:hypothetical protein
LGVDSSEEAASVALVTSGSTKLIDLHEKRIRVAIEVEAFQFLDVPAFFALTP